MFIAYLQLLFIQFGVLVVCVQAYRVERYRVPRKQAKILPASIQSEDDAMIEDFKARFQTEDVDVKDIDVIDENIEYDDNVAIASTPLEELEKLPIPVPRKAHFQSIPESPQDDQDHEEQNMKKDEDGETKEDNVSMQEVFAGKEILGNHVDSREDESISVPPVGALMLCSFFATQHYVPSFCFNQKGREDESRPGLRNVCDFYAVRGYLPFFCKQISPKGRKRTSEQKMRTESDVAADTVLEQFLRGGGLFPIIPVKLLEKVQRKQGKQDDEENASEVESSGETEDFGENENVPEQEAGDLDDGEYNYIYDPVLSQPQPVLIDPNTGFPIDQKRANLTFGQILGGTLAAGAGLALLNNYINKPKPGYSQQYNPYQQQNGFNNPYNNQQGGYNPYQQQGPYNQYQQPGGYNQFPQQNGGYNPYAQQYNPYLQSSFGSYGAYGRSLTKLAAEQLKARHHLEQASLKQAVDDKNARRSTFNKLVVGGLGVATALAVTNSIFSRPSYGSSYSSYNGGYGSQIRHHSHGGYGGYSGHGNRYPTYGSRFPYYRSAGVGIGPLLAKCKNGNCGIASTGNEVVTPEDCLVDYYFEYNTKQYFICDDKAVKWANLGEGKESEDHFIPKRVKRADELENEEEDSGEPTINSNNKEDEGLSQEEDMIMPAMDEQDVFPADVDGKPTTVKKLLERKRTNFASAPVADLGRGSLNNLVAGGLGLGAGVYLANKFTNPSYIYNTGYRGGYFGGYAGGRPYTGYSGGYGGSYNGGYFGRTEDEREVLATDETGDIATLDEFGDVLVLDKFGREKLSTGQTLALGAIGATAGYFLANKFSNRPSNQQQLELSSQQYGGYPLQSSSGYPSQSFGGYPSQSFSGYPSQSTNVNPFQSLSGFTSQSFSGYPSQSNSGYSSQSFNGYPSQSNSGYSSQSSYGYNGQQGFAGQQSTNNGYNGQYSSGYPSQQFTQSFAGPSQTSANSGYYGSSNGKLKHFIKITNIFSLFTIYFFKIRFFNDLKILLVPAKLFFQSSSHISLQ